MPSVIVVGAVVDNVRIVVAVSVVASSVSFLAIFDDFEVTERSRNV